ncbi:hypothetical protein SAMN06265347_11829 [Halobellus salinus]|nr:hypothetical protein SAMN06265347_11829 [Halobellus salinus]
MTEAIEPAEAVELYIDDRREGLAAATIRSHLSRLKHWIAY